MSSALTLTRGQQRLHTLVGRYGTRWVVAAITAASISGSLVATAISLTVSHADAERVRASVLIAAIVPLVVAPLCTIAVVRLVMTLATAVEELHLFATSDPLTGIANRRRFFTVAEERLVRGDSGDAFLMAMIDVDDFKQVNDIAGHRAGDEALLALSRRLASAVGSDGVAARLGGDEFAVLVPVEDETLATTIETIETATTSFAVHGGIRLDASVGAVVVTGGTGVDDALRQCDLALYDAKAHRRSRTAR